MIIYKLIKRKETIKFIMASNKYCYKAVIEYGDKSCVMSEGHKNIDQCTYKLKEFLKRNILTNNIVFIGIKKYNAETGEEFIPQ